MIDLAQSVVGMLRRGFGDELGVWALAYGRVAPVFYLLPFLNDRVLAGALLKNAVIVVVIAGLRPAATWPPDGGAAALLAAVCSETACGLLLGVALCLPFWIATAIGELIDNQRGATLSDMLDPATGVETSTLAPFVSLFYAAAFLQQGGMQVVVQALADSYRLAPVGAPFAYDAAALGGRLTVLVGQGVVLAAPVLLAMFLADVALGLLSRFCPQLNAFALSLSVKSVVAFAIFQLYFATVLEAWFALPSGLLHEALPEQRAAGP